MPHKLTWDSLLCLHINNTHNRMPKIVNMTWSSIALFRCLNPGPPGISKDNRGGMKATNNKNSDAGSASAWNRTPSNVI